MGALETKTWQKQAKGRDDCVPMIANREGQTNDFVVGCMAHPAGFSDIRQGFLNAAGLPASGHWLPGKPCSITSFANSGSGR